MNGFGRRSRFDTMPFSFLAREAGRVHVCGHRGYSLCSYERSLKARDHYGVLTSRALWKWTFA